MKPFLSLRFLCLLLAFCMGFILTHAQLYTLADNAYQQRDYTKAVLLYEKAISAYGKDANLFYNQGNSYYHLKEYTKAILAYERALLLAPEMQQAKDNLALSRSHLMDRMERRKENLLTAAVRTMIENRSSSFWAGVALFSFVVMLVAIGVYGLGRKVVFRKAGFGVALVAVTFVFLFNLFAYFKKQQEKTVRWVLMQTVEGYSSPSLNSSRVNTLHEGTTISILNNVHEWYEVELPNGSRTWIMGRVGEPI